MSKTIQPSLSIQQAITHLATEYQQTFPEDYFFRRPSAEPPVFELAICLAGSVSAGAYLAGVTDFLVEALDTWHESKVATPNDVPNHQVRLNAFSGASGGGMTSIILATSLNRKIVPARAGTLPSLADNPLYGAWVKGIDIKYLLDPKDLKRDGAIVQSLLNSDRIAELACSALGTAGTPMVRPYLADPLHVGVTIGNLNGFAHQFGLRTTSGYGYQSRVHEDVVRFALRRATGATSSDGILPRLPTECPVDLNQRPTGADITQWPFEWQLVAQAAMATGAFPAGLLARDVLRERQQCDPRILPMQNGANGRVAILPTLPGAAPSNQYACLCVDGGVFNNEPFEVARTYLAGLLGQNPRAGNEARRAVIMVDPLVQPGADDFERLGPKDTLLHLISGVVFRALVNQGRIHLREWTTAMAEDIYSRYLLAPTKGDKSGEDALAGSAVGAFGGFLCEPHREHDFRLGRRNCQKFLRDHFALPIENKLFDTWRQNTALVNRYALPDDAGNAANRHLPIIPLVGKLWDEPEPEPMWPSPADFEIVRNDIYQMLEKRVDAIYDTFTASLNWWARRYLGFGWMFAKPQLLKTARTTIEDSLKSKGLL